jgi:hypothetical protein
LGAAGRAPGCCCCCCCCGPGSGGPRAGSGEVHALPEVGGFFDDGDHYLYIK